MKKSMRPERSCGNRASSIASAPMSTFTACRRPRSCRSTTCTTWRTVPSSTPATRLTVSARNRTRMRSLRCRTSIISSNCRGSPRSPGCPPTTSFGESPIALNTRVALKNVLAHAAELGMGFNLGIECEVFVLKQDGDGTLSIPNPDDKLVKPCYDLRGFLDNFSWLDKVATCINGPRLGSLLVRSRGCQRPIRVRFQIRRRPDHV